MVKLRPETIKIARVIFYLWLLLLPWQTRFFWTSGWPSEYHTYSIFVTDLVFGVWAGLVTLRIKRDWPPVPFSLKLAVSFLVIGGLLSLIGSVDFWYSVYSLLRVLAAISLIWLIPMLGVSLRTVYLMLLGGILAPMLLGLAQFLFQQSWSSKWLGLALHDPSVSGTSVVEFGLERWLRAYGSLPHPNILGGLLVAGLILSGYFYLKFYVDWDTAARYYLGIGYLSIWVLALAALIATFSRSAWIGFLIGLGIIGVEAFANQRIKLSARPAFIKLMAIAAVVVSLFGFFWTPLFTGRLTGEGRLEVKSFSEREIYKQQARFLASKNWFNGVGFGNFTLAARQVFGFKAPVEFYQPVHDIYWLSFSEIGIMAIGFWLLLFGFLIGRVGGGVGPAMLIFSIFLTIGIFDHYFWSLPYGLWLFWLSLALANLEGY